VARLITINIPNEAGTAGLNVVTNSTYDSANRLTVMTATTHPRTDLTYNKANQVTQLGFAGTSPSNPVYKVTYAYGSVNGSLNTITYDGVNQDRSIGYAYNSDGLRTSALLDSARKVTYQYDRLNRLTREAGHTNWGSESCLHFNGSQSATALSNGTLGDQQNTFVVEARIYLESYPASDAILFERGASGSKNWFRLRIRSDGNVEATIETEDVEKSANWPAPLGEWFHVAAAWTDSAKMDLYYNGFKVDHSSITIGGPLDAFSGSNLTMGTRLVGKIDEVLVRNVIPSSFTVDANYGSAPSGTLAWWHFSEGSGTTAADSSGNSHTATVSSSSWSNASGDLKPSEYEMRYGYDKAGNRTKTHKFLRGAPPSGDMFSSTYNGLNQLTEKSRYLTNWTSLQDKWVYTYDYNGNLTQAQKQNSSGTQLEKWNYVWNPRDQMTSAERRTGTGSGTYAGRVEYQYCLSCDGAMSERKEFSTGSSTTITSWRRYEYDGLNLLRVDERYDSNSNGIDSSDPWRKVEVNTHRPGLLGVLIGKRVYTYSSGTSGTPSGQNDFTYTYDAVGNMVAVYNANSTNRGNEVDYFTQDAFGNELSVGAYAGTAWSTARNSGLWEHQTGKWIDPITGLYYFHARWYDPVVGRFVARDPALRRSPTGAEGTNAGCCNNNASSGNRFQDLYLPDPEGLNPYVFCENDPIKRLDPTGKGPLDALLLFLIGMAVALILLAILLSKRKCPQNQAQLIALHQRAAALAVAITMAMMDNYSPPGMTLNDAREILAQANQIYNNAQTIQSRHDNEVCPLCNQLMGWMDQLLTDLESRFQPYLQQHPQPSPTPGSPTREEVRGP
jgi:RHS repeat-associated protein